MRLCFLISVVLLVLGRAEAQSESDPETSVDMCGMNNLYAPSGVIKSPSYPDRFVGSFNCTYVIEVGWNNTLSLKFVDFQMDSMRSCIDKWVTIICSYDGSPDTETRVIFRYCGTKRWKSSLISDNCPFVKLKFGSNSDNGYTKFRIDYTITPKENVERENLTDIDCGQTLYDSYSGVINLPSDPNITRARINCTYTIVPGGTHEFGLNVSHLDLLTLTNTMSMRSCDYDSVQIIGTNLDNTKTQYIIYCFGLIQTSLQDPYIPFAKAVSIVLVSNRYDPRNAFQIPYYTNPIESSCGRTYFNESAGLIKSPHFPFPHPRNLDCFYEVRVGSNNTVSLQFLAFDLQRSHTSCYDWMTINCTSGETVPSNPLLNRKLCGYIKWTSAATVSGCSVLSIVFHADFFASSAGFKIQYAIAPSDTEAYGDNETEVDCGVTQFTASTDEIILPMNRRRFLSKINCTYTISFEKNHSILIDTSPLNNFPIINSYRMCSYERFTVKCIEGDPSNENVDLCYSRPSLASFSVCQTVEMVLRSEFFDFQDVYRMQYKAFATDDFCQTVERYSNSTGTISTPGYPLFYPPNINCTYSITAGQNKSVSLSFEFFELGYRYIYSSLGYHDRSSGALVIKCNGASEENPFTNRPFSGLLRWPSVIRFHHCSTLDLHFTTFGYSDNLKNFRGFHLSYTVSEIDDLNFADNVSALSCGHTRFSSFYSPYATIYLPYATDKPMGKVNCTYDIVFAPKMTVTFTHENLLSVLRPLRNCSQGNLTFTCVSRDTSRRDTIGPYCANKLPRFDIPKFYGLSFSSCQVLHLTLQYSAYSGEIRSTITYQIDTDECGNTTFTSPNGTITSPRFPQYYPNNTRCKYNIFLNESDTLTLNISRFALEGSLVSACNRDWLLIQCMPSLESNGNPLLNKRLCGERVFPPITISGCQTVALDFVTDSSITRTGFKLDYTTMETNVTNVFLRDVCGNTTFNNVTGIISSPSLPQPYPFEVNCTYVITARENESIALDFLMFNLTGYARSRITKYMHLLTRIKSSNYENYVYNLQDMCDNAWLWISCLSQGNLGRHRYANRQLCGYKSPFTTEFPGCHIVALDYYSEMVYSANSGFRVSYRSVPTGSIIIPNECGNITFDDPSGVIKSPRYPLAYPHKLNCTYTINVPGRNSVALDFQAFLLQGESYSTDCQDDWLQISCQPDGSDAQIPQNRYLNQRLCGYRTPFITTLYGCRTVKLDFHTDSSGEHTGFIVRYMFNLTEGGYECGTSQFENSIGVVMSPNFPLEYPHNLDCIYTIMLQANQFATLTFESLYLDGDGIDCTRDYLQMTCQPYRSGMVVPENPYLDKRLCGRRDPFTTQVYGCSNVTLRLYTDGSIAGGGFRLKYTVNATSGICSTGCSWEPSTATCRCGTTTSPAPKPIPGDVLCGSTSFTNSTGVIMSPNYPLKHPHNLSCLYVISVEENQFATLEFESLDLESNGTNCKFDWLQVNCQSSGSGKAVPENQYVNKKLCRHYDPFKIHLSGCHNITLSFVTDFSSSLGGFKVKYTIESTPDASEHTGGNTSGGKIAVIVVLIIVLIVAVSVAVCLWRKRGGFRKSREDDLMMHITDNDDDQEPLESSGGSVLNFNSVLYTPSSNDRYSHLDEE